MNHNQFIKETLLTEQQVAARVEELGKQISADYKGLKPLVVCVLKGSWIYTADLVRNIDMDVDVDFVRLSSYGSGTTTSGVVNIVQDLSVSVEGRHVIVVEDIVDSGITLSNFVQVLEQRKAASVQITTLLSKKARRKTDIDVKYVGFEIPDEFVVGYGMDFDEQYRALRDVCVLHPQAYLK